MNSERYSRQTMLPGFGLEGQSRLARAHVAVVGLGGLGSAVVAYLAGAGVGHLVLIDHDTVSLSNLQRQVLYSESQVGTSKAQCAMSRVKALNGDVQVTAHARALTHDNGLELLRGCNLVVDCTDNYVVRYLIDDLCEALDIPWVYGSIGEFGGQVSVFGGKTGVRYRHLFPERDELCSLPQTTRGVLGAVPGVIGAIQANEAVKLLTDCADTLDGRLFSIDLLTLETNILTL